MRRHAKENGEKEEKVLVPNILIETINEADAARISLNLCILGPIWMQRSSKGPKTCSAERPSLCAYVVVLRDIRSLTINQAAKNETRIRGTVRSGNEWRGGSHYYIIA